MVGEHLNKKRTIGIAIILFAMTLGLVFQIFNIRFDYNFEKFFPSGDPETEFYIDHRNYFTSDNDFILIAIERKKGIFNSDFLNRINKYTQALEKEVPYVTNVTSITTQSEQLIYPGGIQVNKPYINLYNRNYAKDSARIYNSPELINTLIAKDARSICIYVRHEDYIPKEKSDVMLKKIYELTDKYDFESVHMAGRTIGQKYYVDTMMKEMLFLVVLSMLLIITFLILSFRSMWGLLLSVCVIILAGIWVLGLMGSLGIQMNLLLITLPSIMFVVIMSDLIHFLSHYTDCLREGLSKGLALNKTFRETGFSTFLTALTTSIGFCSLYFSYVEPIQLFGIVTGIGVLIAFFMTFTVLPVLIILFPSPQMVKDQSVNPFWNRSLNSIFQRSIRDRRFIVILYSCLFLISVWGINKIEKNNYLMEDIAETDSVKKDFVFLDQHFGGIRPFELAVIVKDKNLEVWDVDVLNEIGLVEDYLERNYGVQVKHSLVRTVKVLYRSKHSGITDYYRIPDDQVSINEIRRIAEIYKKGEFVRTIVDVSDKRTRINGTIPDIGSKEALRRNDSLKVFISKLPLKGKVDYSITGMAHLYDKNLGFISISLEKGLTVSVLLIALIMGLLYRSVAMVVISLIPNLIPLCVVGATMGYLGIELKMSTAIIFTIAFGISVDDTIHFLGRFKQEIALGYSKTRALKRTYVGIGKAMILTSIVLSSGFGLLMFSSYQSAFVMGLLLSLTLLIAVFTELTLLPVLILLFYKPKSSLKSTK